MSLKKVKKIIAQFLVVALLIPELNVQALENINSSQEKTNTQVESIKENSEENSQENSNSFLEGENVSDIQEETNTTNDSEKTNTEEEEVKVEQNDNLNLKEEENQQTTTTSKTNQEKVDSKEGVTEEATPKKGTVYNKKKAFSSNVKAFAAEPELSELDEELREFAMIKKAAVEEIEFLEPLTDKKYELTVANSDGSYEFIDSYDEYDKAVNSANTLKDTVKASGQVPAVINYEGAVVYSTNQMGRLVKVTAGKPSYSGTVNLYTDSTLTKAFTYLNISSIEDVPVLETTSTAAKVMVNGYVGWIPNNVASGTYNLIYVPMTTATNPSYYTVTNGELVHFISLNLVGTTGANIVLGKAPSYLKEGVRYLSYDGMYFYEYNSSTLPSKYNILINDYKVGLRTNALNKTNPHYLYYQTLPFRSKTVYTAAELDRFIANNTVSNSKLRNIGQALKNAEATYGVNAVLMLSVAINESGFGTSYLSQTKNNLFGMGAVDSNPDAAYSYATPGDSVLDFAKNFISSGYADPADWRYYGGFLGNKNRGANVKYASDPFWGEKAAKHAYSVDKYLSGGNSNLRDTNSNQIGMAVSNTPVITKTGTLLYNITNDTSQYAAYLETPFVITDLQTVTMNGNNYYSIYPERTTPLDSPTNPSKFSGLYNWPERGYVLTSSVKLLNIFTPQVEVMAGPNRYDTGVALSRSSFTSANTIVIANGYAIPDGLAATPIASYYKGPLLLVETKTIPASVKNEIKRLGAENVVIVGDEGVVSKNVENELISLGIKKITRLGGKDRYETTLKVAKYIDQNLYNIENIVVANGLGEADALSIAPVSGRDNMPLILVKANEIPEEVNAWLKAEDINNAYIIGSNGVVSDAVLNKINGLTKQNITGNRLGGVNRYETNAKVIERFYGTVVDKAYITKGLPLADALTTGPVAALSSSPVILSDNTLSANQKAILGKKTTNKIIQVGGTVSSAAVKNLKELLSRTQ